MSDDGIEGIESSGTEGQENALIRDLRRQLADQGKEIKKLRSQEDILEQVRASTAENLLKEAGYPGLKDDVLEKVEGIPTEEAVSAFLEARGLLPSGGESESSQEESEGQPQVSAEGLAETAGLGQQVASAAQPKPANEFQAKMDATENIEDISAMMDELKLSG